MFELHWTFGWTLAAAGVGWLVLSVLCALALGRIIRRTNQAAEREQVELSSGMDVATPDAESASMAAVGPRFTVLESEQPELDAYDDLGEASRATSGTRFKAVVIDDERADDAKRRVS